MKLSIYKHILHLGMHGFILYAFITNSYAQNSPIILLQTQYEDFIEKVPLETIHIHTDRNHYVVGDTLWYKSYVLDYSWGGKSDISGIIYVDLIDEDGKIYIRNRQHLDNASAAGFIPLVKDRQIKPGRYLLRGYTQYLLNFGSDFIFKKVIDIDGGLPVPFQMKVDEIDFNATDSTYISAFPLSLHYYNTRQKNTTPFNVKFSNKGVDFYQQPMLNDSAMINLSFPKSYALQDISLRVENENSQLEIPLYFLSRNKTHDIQILPEGGHVVSGLSKTFGIKALNIFGEGESFEGFVYNGQNQRISQFNSLYAGMGYIKLDQPVKPTDYIVLTFKNGLNQTVHFPSSQQEGVVIQVDRNSIHQPQYFTTIQVSSGIASKPLGLAVLNKGKIVYGAHLPISQNTHRIALDKSALPHGILEICVVDEAGQYLASRKVFHNKHTSIPIHLEPFQESPITNKPIDLKLRLDPTITKNAHFSISITDNYQVMNPEHDISLLTSYFLQSEIKGHIEKPGFYFSNQEHAPEALDNLMLTQGWVAYSPALIEQVKNARFPIEKKYSIFGIALNAINRGVENTHIRVRGFGNTTFQTQTTTDKNGIFFISDEIPPFDTAYFEVEAMRPNNSSFNLGLNIHEEPFLTINPEPFPYPSRPWYLQINPYRQNLLAEQDKILLALTTGDTVRQLNHILLDEVEILNQKPITGSSNPNGSGNADRVFDLEDLKPIKHKTLFDFIDQDVEGLEVSNDRFGIVYRIANRPVIFILNGIPVNHDVSGHAEDRLAFYYKLFSTIPLSDIVGIEVSYSTKYTNLYRNRFHNMMTHFQRFLPTNAYIEITTRNGVLPYKMIDLYDEHIKYVRPHPFHYNKTFYSPKYTIDSEKTTSDRRATLFWDPYVVPDQNGHIQLQFHSSYRAGTYSIKIEGLDEDGNLYVETKQIKVHPAKN